MWLLEHGPHMRLVTQARPSYVTLGSSPLPLCHIIYDLRITHCQAQYFMDSVCSKHVTQPTLFTAHL